MPTAKRPSRKCTSEGAPEVPARKRGRPRNDGRLDSADANYQALAWQAKQRIDEAAARGKKLSIRSAVRMELEFAIARDNDEGKPTSLGLLDVRFDTHYTKARKWLKRWKKAALSD